ncbi:hypothetical protein [Embleya sp. NPDC005575]|uniref:hypothetical protein n=1 Tax=Embleya sp. NPDC005575 TaxID=3156892 RepID=UPI0033BB097D
MTNDGLILRNVNLFVNELPAPPPGRYTHLGGTARLPHLIEIFLGDDEGRLWHIWALRGNHGGWRWHSKWPEFRTVAAR